MLSITINFLSHHWVNFSFWHIKFSNDLQEESPLAKITRDSAKITVEQVHGLMSQVIANTILLPKYVQIFLDS